MQRIEKKTRRGLPNKVRFLKRSKSEHARYLYAFTSNMTETYEI